MSSYHFTLHLIQVFFSSQKLTVVIICIFTMHKDTSGTHRNNSNPPLASVFLSELEHRAFDWWSNYINIYLTKHSTPLFFSLPLFHLKELYFIKDAQQNMWSVFFVWCIMSLIVIFCFVLLYCYPIQYLCHASFYFFCTKKKTMLIHVANYTKCRKNKIKMLSDQSILKTHANTY